MREALRARVRAGTLAAVSAQSRDCNVALELLACSRRTAYREVSPERPNSREIGRWSPAVDVAGAGALAALANGRAMVLDTSPAIGRSVAWDLDLAAARWPLRWGPIAREMAPTLERVDLFGADCPRATHTIAWLSEGGYRVRAIDPNGRDEHVIDASACQPPAVCDEAIAMTLAPLRAGPCPPGTFAQQAGCVRPPESFSSARPLLVADVPRATCPPASIGQATEQAAQAKRLFDGEKWADAYLASVRVAHGETGDDLGNQQIAAWQSAVALDRLGDRTQSAALMAAIAAQACHVAHDRAAFYLTALERRAQP